MFDAEFPFLSKRLDRLHSIGPFDSADGTNYASSRRLDDSTGHDVSTYSAVDP